MAESGGRGPQSTSYMGCTDTAELRSGGVVPPVRALPLLWHKRDLTKVPDIFTVSPYNLGSDTICLCVFMGGFGTFCHPLSPEDSAPPYPEKLGLNC